MVWAYLVIASGFACWVVVPILNFGFLCCEEIDDQTLHANSINDLDDETSEQFEVDLLASPEVIAFQKQRRYELSMVKATCFWGGLYKPESNSLD